MFENSFKMHSLILQSRAIFRRKKDGDWYIYPYFLAHENLNNAHKNVQKRYTIFKPRLLNVHSTGTHIVKIWFSLCLLDCVRFARPSGKMYIRHLFSCRGMMLRDLSIAIRKSIQRYVARWLGISFTIQLQRLKFSEFRAFVFFGENKSCSYTISSLSKIGPYKKH